MYVDKISWSVSSGKAPKLKTCFMEQKIVILSVLIFISINSNILCSLSKVVGLGQVLLFATMKITNCFKQ